MFDTRLDSSFILSGQYRNGVLMLEFARGNPKGFKVPQHIWGGLLEQNQGKELARQGIPGYEDYSVGRFYNQNIRLNKATGTGFEAFDVIVDAPEPVSDSPNMRYEVRRTRAGEPPDALVVTQYAQFAIIDAGKLAREAKAQGEPISTVFQVVWCDGKSESVVQTMRLDKEAK
jgi:hypothetical protein